MKPIFVFILVALVVTAVAFAIDWQAEKTTARVVLQKNWLRYLLMLTAPWVVGWILTLRWSQAILVGLGAGGIYWLSRAGRLFWKTPDK